MNNYYVYLHITKEDGLPFYVGKGTANRDTSLHGRNKWWKNIVNKYDYDIVFLEIGLTPEEASNKEMYWISRIGRRDLNKGPLVNLTDGGEGTTGKLVTIEMRERMIGNKNPFYNQKHTEETRNKIRESNKRRFYSKEREDKRIKNSLINTLYGDVHCRGKLLLNLETGVFYVSIREASRTINMREDTLRFHLKRGVKNKTNFINV